MNRNEFYKELMSEYTFNSERIKSNAKKGRFAGQRNLPLFIGLTAAAAVCTVAVGTAVALMNSNHGVNLIPESDGLAALSANERLQRALEEIELNADSKELRDVLVTFTAPYGADEVRALLTSYSESIFVKQLYFADGTKAVTAEQVGAAFDGGAQITGAVINCEGAMMKSLQSDSRIFSVEIVTESDLQNVAPIKTEDAETIEVPTNPNFSVDVPVTPDQILVVTTEAEETFESIETGEYLGEVVIEETEESEETVVVMTEEFESEEETADVPEEISTEENVQPSEPEPENTPASSVPAGITFPAKPEKFSFDTDYIGAESAFFINDSCYFVKTADSIMLYGFDGSRDTLIDSAECADARIVWIAENGGRMIVSGVGENGMRNKLLFVSASNGIITDLGAEDIVMDGTLTGVGYNDDSRLLVMNIKENGTYYVCTASVTANGSASYLATCFESDSKVTLLAVYDNNVYLAVSHGGLTQIFRIDAISGGSTLIKTYDTSPSISRNLAFTHAVISPADSAVVGATEIFDPATESFISAGEIGDSVYFGASKHSYCKNGAYYTVTGGEILGTENVSTIAKVEYRKGLSSLYLAAVNDGYVRITESTYSSKAKSEYLAYGDIEEYCSAELRAALNNALGLQNALALGRVSESGIDTLNSLNGCVKALYTTGAAAELKSACGISDFGAIRYNGAAVLAVNTADAKLVVTSQSETTATGTLYIKAGTIGGRTAYFTRSVSFSVEDGCWKLGTVVR